MSNINEISLPHNVEVINVPKDGTPMVLFRSTLDSTTRNGRKAREFAFLLYGDTEIGVTTSAKMSLVGHHFRIPCGCCPEELFNGYSNCQQEQRNPQKFREELMRNLQEVCRANGIKTVFARKAHKFQMDEVEMVEITEWYQTTGGSSLYTYNPFEKTFDWVSVQGQKF